MTTLLDHPLAIPIFGLALYSLFLWRIFASTSSGDPKYPERICRILNRFKNEAPTQLIARFLARVGIPNAKFSYVRRPLGLSGRILIVWIKEEECAFIEGNGTWEIFYKE